MTRFLLILLVTLSVHAPCIAQPDQPPSPGTVTAMIEWLEISRDGTLCGQNKPLIAEIRLIEVKQTGSGLINPPTPGDTIRIELRGPSDLLPTANETATYTMKENPCFAANESYYTIYYQ